MCYLLWSDIACSIAPKQYTKTADWNHYFLIVNTFTLALGDQISDAPTVKLL